MTKQETSEYEKQVINFLIESGTPMEYIRLGTVIGFPFDKTDKNKHTKYRIILSRGEKSYDFPFYDSSYNYKNKIDLTPYDVLACLEKWEPEKDVWEFARSYGYDINSAKDFNNVSKIYQSCVDEYNALLDLYGEEWMEELRKIN